MFEGVDGLLDGPPEPVGEVEEGVPEGLEVEAGGDKQEGKKVVGKERWALLQRLLQIAARGTQASAGRRAGFPTVQEGFILKSRCETRSRSHSAY